MKITYRLDNEHSKILSKLAQKHNKSLHLLARELTISAIEDPEISVKSSIEGLEASIAFLNAEITDIKAMLVSLNSSMASSIELLLIHLGDTDREDAREVVNQIFFK